MTAAASVVVLTPEQLTELVRSAVAAAVAEVLAVSGPATPPERDRLTTAEAAQACRCSERQIRRLLSSGRLRATRLTSGGSSRLLITKRSVDALLAEDS